VTDLALLIENGKKKLHSDNGLNQLSSRNGLSVANSANSYENSNLVINNDRNVHSNMVSENEKALLD
jgi:hypothetical protein